MNDRLHYYRGYKDALERLDFWLTGIKAKKKSGAKYTSKKVIRELKELMAAEKDLIKKTKEWDKKCLSGKHKVKQSTLAD